MGAIVHCKVVVLALIFFQELFHARKCLDGSIEYAH